MVSEMVFLLISILCAPILNNLTFQYRVLSVYTDNEGNIISIDVDICHISIKLINVYIRNRDTPDFYTKLKNITPNSHNYVWTSELLTIN